jgi:hypothetical protein
MKKLLLALFTTYLISSKAFAGAGVNVGIGIPFVSQLGVNLTFGSLVTIDLTYNNLSLDVDTASVDLTMPEALFKFHPFAGSFFVGAGVGKQALNVSATDADTGAGASLDVETNTTILKLGWMWGKANGGFWFGIDFSRITPSDGTVTITTTGGLPTDSQEYLDVQEAGNDFATSSYYNVTMAKFGWLF